MNPSVGDYIEVTGGIAEFIGGDTRLVGKNLLGVIGLVVTYRQRLIQIINKYRPAKCPACSNATWTCIHGDGVQAADYIAIRLLGGPYRGKTVSADALSYKILSPLEILAAQI